MWQYNLRTRSIRSTSNLLHSEKLSLTTFTIKLLLVSYRAHTPSNFGVNFCMQDGRCYNPIRSNKNLKFVLVGKERYKARLLWVGGDNPLRQLWTLLL